eukprot:scaffold22848_cov21-Tisochrysis_lutea.AAC.2
MQPSCTNAVSIFRLAGNLVLLLGRGDYLPGAFPEAMVAPVHALRVVDCEAAFSSFLEHIQAPLTCVLTDAIMARSCPQDCPAPTQARAKW